MEIFKAGGKEFLVVRFTTEHYTNLNVWKLGKYTPQFTDSEGIEYLRENPSTGILVLEEAEADEFFRKPLIVELERLRKKCKLNNRAYIFYQGTGQDNYMPAYLKRVPKWITFIRSHTAPYNLITNWTRSYSDNHKTLDDTRNFYTPQKMLKEINFERKFLIYSGKPRVPRLMMYKMLQDNNLLKESYYSFGSDYIKRFKRYMSEEQFADILSQDGFEEYKGKLEIDFLPSRRPTLSKKEIKAFINISKFLPIRVLPNKEGEIYHEDYYYDPYFILPDPKLYKSIFLDVVMETFNHRGCVEEAIYHDINFFTEKIFKPVLACRPFMVLANRGYLKSLKELFGFKTFDKFWDESYDSKHDVRDAINIIEDNMRMLDSLGYRKLEVMLYDMKDILIHNNKQAFKYLTEGEMWRKVMKDYLNGKGVSWDGAQELSAI